MSTAKQLSEAERIAEMLGIVVGAASHCPKVSEERLTSVAGRVKEVVHTAARGEAEAEAAGARFQWALEIGKAAAASGSIDPDTAETALNEVEEELSA